MEVDGRSPWIMSRFFYFQFRAIPTWVASQKCLSAYIQWLKYHSCKLQSWTQYLSECNNKDDISLWSTPVRVNHSPTSIIALFYLHSELFPMHINECWQLCPVDFKQGRSGRKIRGNLIIIVPGTQNSSCVPNKEQLLFFKDQLKMAVRHINKSICLLSTKCPINWTYF